MFGTSCDCIGISVFLHKVHCPGPVQAKSDELSGVPPLNYYYVLSEQAIPSCPMHTLLQLVARSARKHHLFSFPSFLMGTSRPSCSMTLSACRVCQGSATYSNKAFPRSGETDFVSRERWLSRAASHKSQQRSKLETKIYIYVFRRYYRHEALYGSRGHF